MSGAATRDELHEALRSAFGLDRFRPGQRAAIEAVLAGRDVLCVMPTGGGKSLCYQLPAVVHEGLTLVVSPLIALMKDQVDRLVARGLRASYINSTLDPGEQALRLHLAESGGLDLLYVAPERFRSGRFLESMRRARPALLAVDEAHCISEWGHDFRPDYTRLGRARHELGMPPCIALTATATDVVRRDIAAQLDLRDPAEFVTGFDRENLTYKVVEARRNVDRLTELRAVLADCDGSAIVYASSRRRCEEVASYIEQALDRRVVVYHAGLTREDRTAAQDAFMGNEAEVVVATNAFGMGVDKPDIRAVVHVNMPGTIEAYYQEAGRAGRDGLPARCVLLHAPGDRILQERFIEAAYPGPDVVFRLYETLRGLAEDPVERTQGELAEMARVEEGESAVGAALRILEGAGALERFPPRENMAIVRLNAEAEEGPLADRLSPQAGTQRVVLAAVEGLVGKRYGELIYFQPDGLAQALGLERTSLQRALKILAGELPLDYIPPFRGHAIRLVDRDRPARELGIDFRVLAERKQDEYAKLDRIVGYTRTRQCRRAYLLSYFADEVTTAGAGCTCDNCGGGEATAGGHVVQSAAGREVLLKALSGVARVRGRFGKTLVAQMLVGSHSEKMETTGLSRLSTFGLLGACGFRQPEVQALLDALQGAGLLECVEVGRHRPVLGVTEAGWAFLKGASAEAITLRLDPELAFKVETGGLERRAPKPAPAPGPGAEATPDESGADEPADPAIVERLSALRARLATEAKVPRYCILYNETIDRIARSRPDSLADLQQIKGMGPAKVEKYGAAILEAVRESRGTPADRPSVSIEPEPVLPLLGIEPTPPPAEDARAVPSAEWTARLIERGFRLDEIAALRGLSPAVIEAEARDAAGRGRLDRADARRAGVES
jgi:ATP-dependent DNA helicase RecQ